MHCSALHWIYDIDTQNKNRMLIKYDIGLWFWVWIVSKINFIYVTFYRCFMLNDSEIVVWYVILLLARLSFLSFFPRCQRCRSLCRYIIVGVLRFAALKIDWIVEMCQPENGNELTLIRINQTYEWYGMV